MQPLIGALGGSWVADPDGQRISPTSRKQSALLSMLLLDPGRTCTFETLTDALWPDKAHDEVSQTLRVHMSNLRRWMRDHATPTLVDVIATRPNGYELQVRPKDTDVGEFSTLVAHAQAALASADASTAQALLDEALALWGDPYPDIDHHLAEVEINRVTVLRELAVDELVNARLALGNGRDVVGELESRVKAQPWREQVHRQLMVALYQSGRQTEALEVYRNARSALIERLGVEPGQQLRETHAAILNHTLAVLPARRTTSHPDRSAEADRTDNAAAAPTLFGREAEIHALLDAVHTNSIMVVFGDAGFGKTELLQHAQRVAPDRSWIDCIALRDREAPSLWPVLAALGLTSPNRVDDATEAFVRNQSIIDALMERPAPVLVIDDFHWADEATIGLVRQIAATRPPGLAVILALRNSPLELEGPGGQVATQLSRQPSACIAEIGPLDLKATSAVIAAHAPDRAENAAELLQRSAGNPLFLRELLRSTGDAITHSGDVPPAIASLVAERLSDLHPVSAEILSIAAVVGTTIELDLLLRVHPCPVDELVQALDAGHRISVISSSSGTDTFVHALIRDGLKGRVDSVTARGIHDRAAQALDRDDGDIGRLSQCARHAVAALPIGSASRAVRTSLAAGRHAAESFAFSDACGFLEDAHRALEYLDDQARDDALPGVLCEWGRNLIRSGANAEGGELVMRGGSLARDRGDIELFALAARSIGDGRATQSLGPGPETAFIEEALHASEGLIIPDRVRLLTDVAGSRYFSHSVEHRRELADQAVELSKHFDERRKAEAMMGKVTALHVPSTSFERVAWTAEASASAHRCGSAELIALTASAEIVTHLEQGNRDTAEKVLERTRSVAAETQAPRLRWALDGFDVVAAILDGDFDRADQLALESLMGWDGGRHPDAIVAYGSQIVAIGLLRCDPTVPRQVTEATLALGPTNLTYRTVLAYVLALEDDPAASEVLLEVAQRVIDDPRDQTLILPITSMIGEVAALTGSLDPKMAQALADIVAPLSHLHVFMNAFGTCGFPWGSMHHGHGLLLAAAGDMDAARAALHLAVAANTHIGSTTFTARSQLALDSLGVPG